MSKDRIVMLLIAICLLAGVLGGMMESGYRNSKLTSEKVLEKQCYIFVEKYYPTWIGKGYIYVGNIPRGDNFTARIDAIHKFWLEQEIWQDGKHSQVMRCFIDPALNGRWRNGTEDKDLVPIFISTYDKFPSEPFPIENR
jgi:hypothetical protein